MPLLFLRRWQKLLVSDLPVIIDTPLGRLDSQHRDKLINHYFPFASHQVVLLSTDTEVDERYFVDQLRDDISHAYEIVFNTHTKSSALKLVISGN